MGHEEKQTAVSRAKVLACAGQYTFSYLVPVLRIRIRVHDGQKIDHNKEILNFFMVDLPGGREELSRNF
jgi:hypothetical protein